MYANSNQYLAINCRSHFTVTGVTPKDSPSKYYGPMEAAKTTARLTWQRALPYVLVIGGIIGLIASATLTYDKIHVLADPNYQPGCNLNPVLSCGSVMKTSQASLFGVPNSVFGVLAFSALTVFGLLLIRGQTFSRRSWLIVQAVATVGVVFMH